MMVATYEIWWTPNQCVDQALVCSSSGCCRRGAAIVAPWGKRTVLLTPAVRCAGRIEARAAAANAGDERLALRKLGRRLREVHGELAQYDALVTRYTVRTTTMHVLAYVGLAVAMPFAAGCAVNAGLRSPSNHLGTAN